MLRRTFLSSAPGLLAQRSRRPNIVMILLDDLGPGDLGCYGQKLIKTPHIDAVAAQGRRFTACYAGGAVCAPSRSVLMTGLHTGHTPIRANAATAPLESGDLTIAKVLQGAGYRTGGFGKWGLGDIGSTGVPWKHGFDEFFGYLHQTHAHTYFPAYLWDNDRKVEFKGNQGGKGNTYSADVIANRTFQFLEKQSSDPFFLYACWTLPHGRFEIPSLDPYRNEPWTEGQKNYAAMVTRADGHVGRVMEILRRRGVLDNTWVFVASDNGGTAGPGSLPFFKSNMDLRAEKGTLYEGGIRVPMIVRGPGVQAGSLGNYPWAFCDLFPTWAALAGQPAPKGLDGVDVTPALRGLAGPPRECLYWEQQIFNQKIGRLVPERRAQAVRAGDWKAVRPSLNAPVELYNLGSDPREQRNLAGAEPAVLQRLTALMEREHRPSRPHAGWRPWDWSIEAGREPGSNP